MPKLETIKLYCLNPEAQKRFYCTTLGMREFEDGSVGYGPDEARLLFDIAETAYEPAANHLYWKITIAVPNINLALQQLQSRRVDIGKPRQFGTVGYLAHFSDPEGFPIELIDHWFEGDRPSSDFDNQLLGGGPHLNLLTLRTHDLTQHEAMVNTLGMTPLSIIPVPQYGFTLHFCAFTQERPPNPALLAIENRTWVYRRPYTVLEIQHRPQEQPMAQRQPGQAGYGGAHIAGLNQSLANPYGLMRHMDTREGR